MCILTCKCIVFLAETEAAAENESGEVTNASEKVEALTVDDAPAEGDEKKKKKKKNKNKSGKGPTKEQTNPPTIPIAELYPDGVYLLVVYYSYYNKGNKS